MVKQTQAKQTHVDQQPRRVLSFDSDYDPRLPQDSYVKEREEARRRWEREEARYRVKTAFHIALSVVLLYGLLWLWLG